MGKYNRVDRQGKRSAKGLGTKEGTGLKKIYRWGFIIYLPSIIL